MSELIHDRGRRKELLKHMIGQLHAGEAPDAVRPRLVNLLGKVPYDEVVEVEQELIAEGMPAEEILELCDVHTEALRGALDAGPQAELPAGHPARVMGEENEALGWETAALENLSARIAELDDAADATELVQDMRVRFNAMMDVEKHYLRKENLLFPFLEKHGITGPPTVMWGKHDEARELLAEADAALRGAVGKTAKEAGATLESRVLPAVAAVSGMIDKERQILLPMCLDTLTEAEWGEVAADSEEIGYCLAAPDMVWRPEGAAAPARATTADGRMRLPTGVFDAAQLEAVLNSIPFDITFVDADDTVRYFSHGRERIFARTRAILGRKVQYCHPPKSVDTVQRILDDFHAGREDHAQFWIEMSGKFICIEYFALRDADGGYLGTLEVSQDLTAKRALTGEQRLLNYVGGGEEAGAGEKEPEAAAGGARPVELPRMDHAGGRPSWLATVAVVETYDAREELASGGHPLARVLAALEALEPGEGYELITPFVPEPMLEKVRALGFDAWSEPREAGVYLTTFHRSQG